MFTGTQICVMRNPWQRVLHALHLTSVRNYLGAVLTLNAESIFMSTIIIRRKGKVQWWRLVSDQQRHSAAIDHGRGVLYGQNVMITYNRFHILSNCFD